MGRKEDIQAQITESERRFKEAFPVSKRIQQLESYLQDDSLSHQHVNIRAAIKMYKAGEIEYEYRRTISWEKSYPWTPCQRSW